MSAASWAAIALLLYTLPILVCMRASFPVQHALAWPLLLPFLLACDALDTWLRRHEGED